MWRPAELEPAQVHFWPDLREGFPYLGPERTLQLFEDVGVDQLATRLLVVDHWTRSGPPLFKFPELKRHLAALGAYLQYPHQDILRTGFPSTIFIGTSIALPALANALAGLDRAIERIWENPA